MYADIKKSGTEPKVRFSRAEDTCLPYVPVTSALYCPCAAVLDAVNVSTLVLLVETGENEAVTPAGRPEMDRLTLLLDPFCH